MDPKDGVYTIVSNSCDGKYVGDTKTRVREYRDEDMSYDMVFPSLRGRENPQKQKDQNQPSQVMSSWRTTLWIGTELDSSKERWLEDQRHKGVHHN